MTPDSGCTLSGVGGDERLEEPLGQIDAVLCLHSLARGLVRLAGLVRVDGERYFPPTAIFGVHYHLETGLGFRTLLDFHLRPLS